MTASWLQLTTKCNEVSHHAYVLITHRREATERNPQADTELEQLGQ